MTRTVQWRSVGLNARKWTAVLTVAMAYARRTSGPTWTQPVPSGIGRRRPG